MDLSDRPQREAATGSEEENETVHQEGPSKKHPGDALQADMVKRPKTEEGTEGERGAAAHSTKMKQKATTTRKTCDKGDSQALNHFATSRQGTE